MPISCLSLWGNPKSGVRAFAWRRLGRCDGSALAGVEASETQVVQRGRCRVLPLSRWGWLDHSQRLINISKPLRGLFICFGAICLFAILQKSGHFEPPYYLRKYLANLHFIICKNILQPWGLFVFIFFSLLLLYFIVEFSFLWAINHEVSKGLLIIKSKYFS